MDSIKKIVITKVVLSFILLVSVQMKGQKFELRGFAQTNVSFRTANADNLLTPKGESLPKFLLGEERVQLTLSKSGKKVSFLSKTDLYFDAVSENLKLDFREAYLDLSLGKFDIRAGRQIITWGLGDLVFINDIFPKNWVAFISGQPLEYLKFGSDAININFFPKIASFQLIVTPFYQPDVLPVGDRIKAYDPFSNFTTRQEVKPEVNIENTQIAGRIYKNIGKYDVSVYFSRGFYGSPPGILPNFENNSLVMSYPRLDTYGISAQGPFLNGVLSIEGGILNSRDDMSGNIPGIENSQNRFLVSYQRPIGENYTINFQYYSEYIKNYQNMVNSLSGVTDRKKLRHTLSIRQTQYLFYQTLKLSCFALYSPNEKDYYLNPEISYDFGSNTHLSIGGNLFEGKNETTFLGQFNKNDNIYAVLKFDF